jgi:hypothetical protein
METMNLAEIFLAGALALALAGAACAQSANPISSGAQACSTTATALPGGALTNGLVLTADSSNAGKIYVGGSSVTTATGYPLAAGQSISYGSTSPSMIFMICQNTTDTLHFTGN